MDLNFLKGLMSENEIENNASSNMVLLRTPEGDLTFTFENDDRLNDAFKEWEQLCLLTPSQHQSILNIMNTCEWDKKVGYINGDIVKVEKYTPEEKNAILIEKAENEEKAFFSSEKRLALEIEEDYRLGLEDISDSQLAEVKTYMKSIQPKTAKSPMVFMIMPEIKRPEIMKYYEDKNNGVI